MDHLEWDSEGLIPNQNDRLTRQAVLMQALSKYLPEKEINLYSVTETLKNQYMFKHLS